MEAKADQMPTLLSSTLQIVSSQQYGLATSICKSFRGSSKPAFDEFSGAVLLWFASILFGLAISHHVS